MKQVRLTDALIGEMKPGVPLNPQEIAKQLSHYHKLPLLVYDKSLFTIEDNIKTFRQDEERRIGEFPHDIIDRLKRVIPEMEIEPSTLVEEMPGLDGYKTPLPSGYLSNTLQLRICDSGLYMVTLIEDSLFKRIRTLAENEECARKVYEMLGNQIRDMYQSQKIVSIEDILKNTNIRRANIA
jgi:hypothetical protein